MVAPPPSASLAPPAAAAAATVPPAWSGPTTPAAPAPGGSRGRARTVDLAPPPSASLAPPSAAAAGVCHHHRALWQTPLNLRTVLKLVSSATVTSMSICLVYLPLLHHLFDGRLEVTAMIWSSVDLQIGLMDALMWLLYGASVYKRDGGPDVILSCAWSSGVMLCCLMVVCAHTRKLITAALWYVASMISIIGALVILQVEPDGDVLHYLEYIFGFLGIFFLLAIHFVQIFELKDATEPVQILSASLTLLPSFAVFVNVLNGFKLTESAGDLAIAASLCSSFLGFPIPSNVAFIGGVGLGGELRTVPRTEKRVTDIAKLGYKKCVIPKQSEKLLKKLNVDMEILACSNLKQVINTIIRSQS